MSTRQTRNVSLTPELERSVQEKVASGRYRSASEVVRAALRLLDREENMMAAPKAGIHRSHQSDPVLG